MTEAKAIIEHHIIWQSTLLLDKLLAKKRIDAGDFDYLYILSYKDKRIKKVYDYYLISEWLYKALKAQKAPVAELSFLGLYVWGRTSQGQALYMDKVIQDIADEIYKEKIALEN